jgi:hypothetical protein
MYATNQALKGRRFACAAYTALALAWPCTVTAPGIQHAFITQPQRTSAMKPEQGTLVERVDFVLDKASEATGEGSQKKQRTLERRAAQSASNSNAASGSGRAALAGSRSKPSGERSATMGPNQPSNAATTVVTPASEASSTSPLARAPTPAGTSSPAPASIAAMLQPPPAAPAATATQTTPSASASSTESTTQGPQLATPPPRLTQEQLQQFIQLLASASSVARATVSGGETRWTPHSDGSLMVYWGQGWNSFQGHSARGALECYRRRSFLHPHRVAMAKQGRRLVPVSDARGG